MKRLILFFLILIPLFSFGQKRMKKKVTHDKGTIFGYWGYNRDVYTNSNMNFVGPGYDFTLAGVEAKDNPEEFSFDG